MAGICLRLTGFISATVHRAGGFVVPFKTRSRPFCNSHRALEEPRTNPQSVEQVCEDVEYIPQKQAKNPMKSIGIAWVIGLPSGIILFLFTKRQVEKNRLKQLKSRQKMKTSNEGEYERERYRTASLKTETLAETKT
uniref:Uncharacterized protein n=1 Tax=Salvator merianae TaxID=96440 RepID=A0A8D0C603_SALMN